MNGLQLPIQLVTSTVAEGKTLRTILWGYHKYIGLVFTDNTMLVIRLRVGYEDDIEVEIVTDMDDWSDTGLDVVKAGVVDAKMRDAAYREQQRKRTATQKANDLAELQRLKAQYERP